MNGFIYIKWNFAKVYGNNCQSNQLKKTIKYRLDSKNIDVPIR